MSKDYRPLQVLVAVGLILTAACGWLHPGGPPDEASVEITSDDVSQFVVFVSQDFLQIQEESCVGEPDCPVHLVILSADTLVVSGPYTTTIDIAESQRLFLETHPVDSVQAIVSMKVKIDGRDWYDDLRLLEPVTEDGERETLRFVYEYFPT